MKFKFTKRFMAMILSILFIVSLLPTPIVAGNNDKENQVQVIVANNTFSVEDGAMWEGTLVDTWVNINEESTIGSAIGDALESVGASQGGIESGYLYDINGLAAGEPDYMSGWMVLQNDWFINEGISAFSVENGRLGSGDVICVYFSTNAGEDIGGSWNNNDKTLLNISSDVGTLSEEFDKNTYEYTLTIPNDTTSVVITPTAANKNFLVKTNVNGTYFKRTKSIPVEDGTVINVTCGDPSWPTMNGGAYGDADSIPAKSYNINVVVEDNPVVNSEKLSSLIIHTGVSPSDANVLLKNNVDVYTTTNEFSSDIYEYYLDDIYDTNTSLRFRAMPEDDATATIKYYNNGSKNITWKSGTSSWANCVTPGKNVFTITVSPSIGSNKTESIYTFRINCVPTLTALAISENGTGQYLDKAFTATTNDYSVTVAEDATNLEIEATPRSSDYTVLYNGDEDSNVDITGLDSISVDVIAGDGENKVTNTYTININRLVKGNASFIINPSDAVLKVYDQGGVEVTPNSDGSFIGLFSNGCYTYKVSKYGYKAQTGAIPNEGGVINVNLEMAESSQLTVVGAFWANFRNSEVNMAITNEELPIDKSTTGLLWNRKLGTGWSAAPSVQIIVDDSLVVMSGNSIYMLDLETGETLVQGSMVATTNFGYTPATYAEGMIFVPLSGGQIQAFNAETLESLWVYKDPLGGQSLSPITYSDGYIYTGFWNGETKDANFVCISITDEDIENTNESKLSTWNYTQAGGFYWAGSVVIGNTVVVGTDDGASGFSGESYIYSFDKKNGKEISRLKLTGDQRSSIAYSKEKGKIYFTTKYGYLYSAKIDENSGVLSDLKGVYYSAQSTSTPVVYNDRVYFGTGSGISSTGSSGNFVVADADTLEMMYAVGLKGYPQCSMLLSTAYLDETGYLYFYSTYNQTPGGVSMIKVKDNSTNVSDAELVELYDANGFSQYCITSIICGENGDLYYKNDSSNIFCVGTIDTLAVINLISKIGEVGIDSKDAIINARIAYDMLTIEEKDEISNYDILVDAEKTYSAILINSIVVKIEKIGSVTLDSRGIIENVRNEYDVLSDIEKTKITNYSNLVNAEETLSRLTVIYNAITCIGNVTLSSKESIANARLLYELLSSNEKKQIINYNILVFAEQKYEKLVFDAANSILNNNVPNNDSQLDNNKTNNSNNSSMGYTSNPSTNDNYNNKNVGTTFAGTNISSNMAAVNDFEDVSLQNYSKTNEVINLISNLTKNENIAIEDVLVAYKEYNNLSEEDKKLVTNLIELSSVVENIAKINHTDEKSGIYIKNANWYMKLMINDVSESDKDFIGLQDKIGSNNILYMWDISLENLYDNMENEEVVTVHIPFTNANDYDGVIIAHYKEDGTLEYIECEVKDNEIIFDTSSFSYFAIVGYNGNSPLDLNNIDENTKDRNIVANPVLWIGVGVGTVGILILLCIFYSIKKKEKK